MPRQKPQDRRKASYGHYADLLNDYDGGCRIRFKNGMEWLDRLRELQRKQDEANKDLVSP